MKKTRDNKAITLIALVITIIVLLILAGVSIAVLTGNGLFDNARIAKEKYKNAQENEEDKISKYEDEINAVLGSRNVSEERIREIIQEEISSIKPKSINASSLLMSSSDATLETGTRTLNLFSNSFKTDFTNQFEYNSSNGRLTCKESGWYLVSLRLDLYYNNSYWTTTTCTCKCNGVEVCHVQASIDGSGMIDNDDSSVTLYLNKDDYLEITKITNGGASGNRNNTYANLYKL